MRFITEFDHTHEAYEYSKINEVIASYKGRGQMDLGYQIGDSFGWTEKQDPFKIKNTLEIEAFPMDKWVEFKKRFADALPDYDTVSRTRLINALAALEEFHGKPSGDAITNLPDLEYRGPSSHCKACEDEKNGVKHIMAQKHTCKK